MYNLIKMDPSIIYNRGLDPHTTTSTLQNYIINQKLDQVSLL